MLLPVESTGGSRHGPHLSSQHSCTNGHMHARTTLHRCAAPVEELPPRNTHIPQLMGENQYSSASPRANGRGYSGYSAASLKPFIELCISAALNTGNDIQKPTSPSWITTNLFLFTPGWLPERQTSDRYQSLCILVSLIGIIFRIYLRFSLEDGKRGGKSSYCLKEKSNLQNEPDGPHGDVTVYVKCGSVGSTWKHRQRRKRTSYGSTLWRRPRGVGSEETTQKNQLHRLDSRPSPRPRRRWKVEEWNKDGGARGGGRRRRSKKRRLKKTLPLAWQMGFIRTARYWEGGGLFGLFSHTPYTEISNTHSSCMINSSWCHDCKILSKRWKTRPFVQVVRFLSQEELSNRFTEVCTSVYGSVSVQWVCVVSKHVWAEIMKLQGSRQPRRWEKRSVPSRRMSQHRAGLPLESGSRLAAAHVRTHVCRLRVLTD